MLVHAKACMHWQILAVICLQIMSLPSEMSYHNAVNFMKAVVLPIVCYIIVAITVSDNGAVAGLGTKAERF